MNPIHESIKTKYAVAYGSFSKEKDNVEKMILDEFVQIKEQLNPKQALMFSHHLNQLENELIPQKQKIWRIFVYCHFVFLYGKKMLTYDTYLLKLVCDSVTKENIKDNRYLAILSDKKWMIQVLEHAIYVDFCSTLSKTYKIDYYRIHKVFVFLCHNMWISLKTYSKGTNITVIKKQLMKKIKTYRSDQLFKRGVII